MKKNSGFTLLELLITVALISIVMAIAVPSMTTFTQNDRLTTNINTIVYIDADGDNSFTAGEEVLRAQQALEGANTLTSTIGAQVTYDYRGFVNAASVGSFQLCDGRSGPYGKTIRISTTGRVRHEDGSTC